MEIRFMENNQIKNYNHLKASIKEEIQLIDFYADCVLQECTDMSNESHKRKAIKFAEKNSFLDANMSNINDLYNRAELLYKQHSK